MAFFNPLTGWTGEDADAAREAAKTVEGAKAIGKAGPTGGVAYGADRFVAATPGQYGQSVGSINPDPRYPVGSPEWLAYYAPEYLDDKGNVMSVGGAEVVYGSERGPTIRGRRPTGLRDPWSGVQPGMAEDQVRQWMDSKNYFKTGQGIDPRVVAGLQVDNPFAEQWEPMTASNQFGKLTLGAGPSIFNPYGLNAQFDGTGIDGSAYQYRDNYWGYVNAAPDGQVVVPGWNTTAKLIGHPSFQPGGPNLYYGSLNRENWPWSGLPAGTNVTGWYGWLTPEAQKRADAMRNSATRGQSGQSGQEAKSQGKWRRLENGNWLHVSTGKIYDQKGKLISG